MVAGPREGESDKRRGDALRQRLMAVHLNLDVHTSCPHLIFIRLSHLRFAGISMLIWKSPISFVIYVHHDWLITTWGCPEAAHTP